MNTVYKVYMTMEGGTPMTWLGEADDRKHAEGLAIEWATERTNEQVAEIECWETV